MSIADPALSGHTTRYYSDRMQSLQREARNFESGPLGEELLLLDKRYKTVHLLSPDLAYIWKGLESGLVLREMAGEVAAELSLPYAEAEERCSMLLLQIDAEIFRPARQEASAARRAVRISLPRDAQEVFLALRGTVVRFVFSDRQDARSVSEHLDALVAESSSTCAAECAVLRLERGLVFAEPKTGLLEMVDGERLLLAVYTALHRVFLKLGDYSLALHAAAVEHAGRAVLLAGKSGAGKSTVAAALCGRGGRLLSEDTLLVSSDGEWFLPTSPLIRVRTFVREYVAGIHPELTAAPLLRGRADGEFSFLRLPVAEPTPCQGALLVLLQSGADAAAPLTALPLAAGGGVLRELVAAGCIVSGSVQLDTLRKVLEKLTSAKAIVLRSSSFEDSLQLLLGADH